MKYQNIIPALLIFAAFLITGIWIGRWLGHSLELNQLESRGEQLQAFVDMQDNYDSPAQSNAPQKPRGIQSSLQASDRRPRQKQRNLLLIGVDQLDKRSPALESVWLILYIPDLPHIIWMPIYPGIAQSADGVRITASAELVDTFRLDRDSKPTPEFLEALEHEGIPWDNYAVIDQTAAIDLINILGGIETPATDSAAHQKMSGEDAFAGLHSTTDGLHAALLSQAQLIHQLCRISSRYSLNINQFEQIANIQNHLFTDIEIEQLVSDLQTMLTQGSGFMCEFPSLALLSAKR